MEWTAAALTFWPLHAFFVEAYRLTFARHVTHAFPGLTSRVSRVRLRTSRAAPCRALCRSWLPRDEAGICNVPEETSCPQTPARLFFQSRSGVLPDVALAAQNVGAPVHDREHVAIVAYLGEAEEQAAS